MKADTIGLPRADPTDGYPKVGLHAPLGPESRPIAPKPRAKSAPKPRAKSKGKAQAEADCQRAASVAATSQAACRTRRRYNNPTPTPTRYEGEPMKAPATPPETLAAFVARGGEGIRGVTVDGRQRLVVDTPSRRRLVSRRRAGLA